MLHNLEGGEGWLESILNTDWAGLVEWDGGFFIKEDGEDG